MLKLHILTLKIRWRAFLQRMRDRLRSLRSGFSPWLFALSTLYTIFKYALLLTAPFIVLIRGGVYLYEAWYLPHWLALLGGVLLSALLLFIYLTWIYGSVAGRIGSQTALTTRYAIVLLFVLGYALNGLLFLADGNAKHPAVQEEYNSLHPILRLGIGTIVFFDEGVVITDANRKPEDYKQMGLPTKSRSLHYKQSSGYSHAIDIRVNDRGFFRNAITKGYFNLMGFNTLRHGGTADHLHVSLSSRDIPGGI
ncbi:MAG: hypothetical protein ACRBF0_12795 [Calditrichia bacterium]